MQWLKTHLSAIPYIYLIIEFLYFKLPPNYILTILYVDFLLSTIIWLHVWGLTKKKLRSYTDRLNEEEQKNLDIVIGGNINYFVKFYAILFFFVVLSFGMNNDIEAAMKLYNTPATSHTGFALRTGLIMGIFYYMELSSKKDQLKSANDYLNLTAWTEQPYPLFFYSLVGCDIVLTIMLSFSQEHLPYVLFVTMYVPRIIHVLGLHRGWDIFTIRYIEKQFPFMAAIQQIDEDSNAKEHPGGDWTAMIDAVKNGNYDFVRMHTQEGFNLNYQHPESCTTPLMEAARSGHLDIVKLLVESGADPGIKSARNARTSLDFARQQGHRKIITYLRSLPTNDS